MPVAADNPLSKKNNRIVQAIAQLHENNPIAFMQALSPDEIKSGVKVALPEASRKMVARLGANAPLSHPLDGILPPGEFPIRDSETIEGFLMGLQLEMVAAFRNEEKNLLLELENLQILNLPANSTLPIALHRVFGLPILMVEPNNDPVILRIAAPVGSEIANLTDAIENQPGQQNALLDKLLTGFADMPVIWQAENNYAVYLPNHAVEQVTKTVKIGPHKRSSAPTDADPGVPFLNTMRQTVSRMFRL